MKTILDSVSHDPEDVYFLYSTNIIYKLPFKEAFIRDLDFYADGKAYNLDYSKPQIAANKVNKEVKHQIITCLKLLLFLRIYLNCKCN